MTGAYNSIGTGMTMKTTPAAEMEFRQTGMQDCTIAINTTTISKL